MKKIKIEPYDTEFRIIVKLLYEKHCSLYFRSAAASKRLLFL